MSDLEKLMQTPKRDKKEVSAWYYIVAAGFFMLLMILLFGCKKDEPQTCKTCTKTFYQVNKNTGQTMTKVIESNEDCNWEQVDGKKEDAHCSDFKYNCYYLWDCK